MKRHIIHDEIKHIDGRLYVVYGLTGEKLRLRGGTVFNGSRISHDERFAVCTKCRKRHAPGIQCLSCSRKPPKEKRPEHRDQGNKEIKGE